MFPKDLYGTTGGTCSARIFHGRCLVYDCSCRSLKSDVIRKPKPREQCICKHDYEDVQLIPSFFPTCKTSFSWISTCCYSHGALAVFYLCSKSSTLLHDRRGPRSNPGQGYCFMFLGKTLYFHSPSLHSTQVYE